MGEKSPLTLTGEFIMRLSQSDKVMLENSYKNGQVFVSSLEKKRLFNSALKLKKLGLMAGTINYQRQNGYAINAYGRTWANGYSWNEFSGELTAKGLNITKKLLD